MEARIDIKLLFVSLARFFEAPRLAINNAELVVCNGLVRVRLEREQQVALRAFQDARAMLRNP